MKIWHDLEVAELSNAWLLDEHRTVHAYFGMWGYPKLRNHPLLTYDPDWVLERHEQQVEEMKRRGFTHHKSPVLKGDFERAKNLFGKRE